jgi:hypothetical protein
MISEESMDRELGKSRIPPTPPDPRLSSKAIFINRLLSTADTQPAILQDQHRRLRQVLDYQPQRWIALRESRGIVFVSMESPKLTDRSTSLSKELKLPVDASRLFPICMTTRALFIVLRSI